jgi:hypothetical protein
MAADHHSNIRHEIDVMDSRSIPSGSYIAESDTGNDLSIAFSAGSAMLPI